MLAFLVWKLLGLRTCRNSVAFPMELGLA